MKFRDPNLLDTIILMTRYAHASYGENAIEFPLEKMGDSALELIAREVFIRKMKKYEGALPYHLINQINWYNVRIHSLPAIMRANSKDPIVQKYKIH